MSIVFSYSCPKLPALGFYYRKNMAKDKNIFDPEVLLPKVKGVKGNVIGFLAKRKKWLLAIGVILIAFFILNLTRVRKTNSAASTAKTISIKVDKSWDINALTNQGKTAGSKVKFKITTAEKTDQVLVKDQVFSAKNNKLFLILNLEIKNDVTSAVNIVPGDLIRLSYGSDGENMYAPDLHNNMVQAAAISTKNDRVGFVIPMNEKNFQLSIGELDGKKETVDLKFPS